MPLSRPASGLPASLESPCPTPKRSFWRALAMMIVFNLLITVFLLLIGASQGFLDTLKVCNAIGFSIWIAIELLRLVTRGRWPIAAIAVIGVLAGFSIGSKLAAWMGTADLLALLAHDPEHQWHLLVGSLMIALFSTSLFIFYWRGETYRADLQSERRRAAEALQSETAAKLALLQAQIEPHFLFNTLANVQSVIDSDPKSARSILELLNQYLRVSLGRTRRATCTLGDELSLIRSLLGIAAVRLGGRLRYSIEVPDELEHLPLPPLLLQPLVENALEHGIEPAVGGGEIRIEAHAESDSLCLRVSDSGVGMNTGSPEGVGLANVRARLENLYGERGRLALYGREPRGVIAEIVMPMPGA